MLKRILCLLLALTFIVPLVACDVTGDDVTDDSEIKETEEIVEEVVEPMEKSGIILTDEFSFVAENEKDKLKDCKLTKISDLDEKYVKATDESCT